MLRKVILIGLLAVLAGYALYNQFWKEEKQEVVQQPQVEEALANQGLEIGKEAPDFELHALDGSKVKLSDLKGKKVIVGATSNSAVFLEKYNKENNAGIEIVYAGNGPDSTINQIKTGRADATITTPFSVDFNNDAVDAQKKVVGEPLLNSKVYFLLRKDETPLQKRIDEALVELKQEGVISELSKKWLGADYTVNF